MGARPTNTMIRPRVMICFATGDTFLARRMITKSTRQPRTMAVHRPQRVASHSGSLALATRVATTKVLNIPMEPWAKCVMLLVRKIMMIPRAARA